MPLTLHLIKMKKSMQDTYLHLHVFKQILKVGREHILVRVGSHAVFKIENLDRVFELRFPTFLGLSSKVSASWPQICLYSRPHPPQF